MSRRKGGKVFGGGSRSTVAILLLVKNPASIGPCRISYHEVADYLTREDKLDLVAKGSLESIEWRTIEPNAHGDWVNQRDANFDTFVPIGIKEPTSTTSRSSRPTREA